MLLRISSKGNKVASTRLFFKAWPEGFLLKKVFTKDLDFQWTDYKKRNSNANEEFRKLTGKGKTNWSPRMPFSRQRCRYWGGSSFRYYVNGLPQMIDEDAPIPEVGEIFTNRFAAIRNAGLGLEYETNEVVNTDLVDTTQYFHQTETRCQVGRCSCIGCAIWMRITKIEFTAKTFCWKAWIGIMSNTHPFIILVSATNSERQSVPTEEPLSKLINHQGTLRKWRCLFIDLRTTGTVSKKTKPMDAAIIHV
jgi:hypothetical protein